MKPFVIALVSTVLGVGVWAQQAPPQTPPAQTPPQFRPAAELVRNSGTEELENEEL